MEYRQLGDSGFNVSVIGLGCWPIAGIGWSGVDDKESIAAIKKSLDVGINFIDTAYMYGKNGESERLVGRAIQGRRDEVIIATKGGLHWKDDQLCHDSSRGRIKRQVEESLKRLNIDVIDLYQVHAYDENTPLRDTAQTMDDLLREGKIRAIGVSNYSVSSMKEFAEYAPLHSLQPPYNMIMRAIEDEILPHCIESGIGVCVYWPFYKGLLTGKYQKGHSFPKGDSRKNDPEFRGERFERTLDMLDRLRGIADECGSSLAELVTNWTIHQPGVTLAICGATRPDQVEKNARAGDWKLGEDQMKRINEIIGKGDAA